MLWNNITSAVRRLQQEVWQVHQWTRFSRPFLLSSLPTKPPIAAKSTRSSTLRKTIYTTLMKSMITRSSPWLSSVSKSVLSGGAVDNPANHQSSWTQLTYGGTADVEYSQPLLTDNNYSKKNSSTIDISSLCRADDATNPPFPEKQQLSVLKGHHSPALSAGAKQLVISLSHSIISNISIALGFQIANKASPLLQCAAKELYT